MIGVCFIVDNNIVAFARAWGQLAHNKLDFVLQVWVGNYKSVGIVACKNHGCNMVADNMSPDYRKQYALVLVARLH